MGPVLAIGCGGRIYHCGGLRLLVLTLLALLVGPNGRFNRHTAVAINAKDPPDGRVSAFWLRGRVTVIKTEMSLRWHPVHVATIKTCMLP